MEKKNKELETMEQNKQQEKYPDTAEIWEKAEKAGVKAAGALSKMDTKNTTTLELVKVLNQYYDED